jgi:hypothetical protein
LWHGVNRIELDESKDRKHGHMDQQCSDQGLKSEVFTFERVHEICQRMRKIRLGTQQTQETRRILPLQNITTMKHILLMSALVFFGATLSAQSNAPAANDKAQTTQAASTDQGDAKSSCSGKKADAKSSCCKGKKGDAKSSCCKGKKADAKSSCCEGKKNASCEKGKKKDGESSRTQDLNRKADADKKDGK